LARRERERHFAENFEEIMPRKRRSGSTVLRWLRRLVLLALLLLLLPYLLLPLYRVEAVKPVSTLMLFDMVRGQDYARQWTEFDDIAPVLVQSVMMSEDGQFCAHDGIDWGALNAVIDGALEGERTRGASTIPMQTVKNLFLWPGRSFVRKAMEVPLALAADYVWTKRRMMEIYLNVAEWAPGVYGIGAAARHHFGVSPAELTASQAALLAVTLPNPHRRDPRAGTPGMQRLAGSIEGRARQSGAYIRCLYG
jgi:monofunctional glycosyltransferase